MQPAAATSPPWMAEVQQLQEQIAVPVAAAAERPLLRRRRAGTVLRKLADFESVEGVEELCGGLETLKAIDGEQAIEDGLEGREIAV